jgi:hypothetical protein
MNKDFAKLVSFLMHSRTQAHVFHLQTKSYAEHKGLKKYYDDIVDLIDSLIESFQGQYDIIDKYENYAINSYVSNAETIKYFKALMKTITDLRTSVKDDTHLQNEIDNIVNLIASTLYKLKFLK